MTAKNKIARDVAAAEFDRLCDAHRIERDPSGWSEEEAAEFADLRNDLIRDLMSCALIVGEDGLPTYTAGGKGFTFHPATGATLMALETYAGGKSIANMIAALAEMTHTDRSDFGKMAARDVTACSRLAKLFLRDQ